MQISDKIYQIFKKNYEVNRRQRCDGKDRDQYSYKLKM